MSGKLFVAGQSGNTNGRPKGSRYSVLTVKGRIERFLAKQLTATALKKMYEGLKEPEKAKFVIELLPYVMAKQNPEAINQEEIDRLHALLEQKIKTPPITGMVINSNG